MGPGQRRASGNDVRNVLASSFRSGSPLAQQALADDIAACSDDDETVVDGSSQAGQDPQNAGSAAHFMYRRPSGVAYGASRPVFSDQHLDEPTLTPLERQQSRNAERSLLRDNHVLPPKRQNRHDAQQGVLSRFYRRLFSTKVPQDGDGADGEDTGPQQGPSETSPLLHNGGSASSVDDLEEQWEEAIASRRLTTTWQRETKTIATYSAPLIVTFFLQYSINVVAVLAVGRIGSVELGAVSLANMTAAITCLAPFQGLSTSLDTLCAQAYGSGHKHLVGLQFQRMTFFLFSLSIPVAVVWFYSDIILSYIVPNPDSARLAGQYLRVMIFGIPGFILFEGAKRFTQAQGLFRATTYVLLVAAPLHVLVVWLLVYKFELGFIGAPIGVAFTDNLMPLLLFFYVKYVDGSQCWGGFSKRAFTNWWIMIKLALPGMIMVEAEWLAFEILTLVSSRFGVDYLAAQSVVTTLGTISYQIPFPMSIASSTRVANLIGAGLVDAAKITAKVTFAISVLIGILNLVLYGALRYHLPLLFTDDPAVIEICAQVLPVVAVLQVFDALSAGAHGLLRGIGKQAIGGPANLIAYYLISLPISLGLALGLDWKLQGLWAGVIVGLATVSIIEYVYLLITDWEKAAREAETRNAAG